MTMTKDQLALESNTTKVDNEITRNVPRKNINISMKFKRDNKNIDKYIPITTSVATLAFSIVS